MLQSVLLGRTYREEPRDAQTVSHRLMLRGGYLRQTTAGIYSYLPLLHRVIRKISQIIREEMDAAGAQELTMPALQPSEIWQESGRWKRYTEVDGIMFALDDRRGGALCLGPTHEEVITDIIRQESLSYKDLPKTLYQIQTKFRDEIRPRFGLMRAREFIMKDAYSFDTTEEGLHLSYQKMFNAYSHAFKRMGLEFRAVEADSGAIGGSGSQEFMVLADSGEDTVIYCNCCDYAANRERAVSRLASVPEAESTLRPMRRVQAPGVIGVAELSAFLGVPTFKTTKTVLYMIDSRMVAVMIRGDCEINEVKLANTFGAEIVRLATSDEIESATGAKVGYAGPVGLPQTVTLVADESVKGLVNFESGANETGSHNVDVNFERDFPTPRFVEIRLVKAGDRCTRCEKGALEERKGIEVGHVFKLGTKYSVAMNCNFVDLVGVQKPAIMGCYGIGVSRIAASAIEQSHDEHGIIWPSSIAPFDVHLVGLNLEESDIRHSATDLYNQIQAAGLTVLFDDRDMRAGEKFADSDLIGIPARVTMSKKSLGAGGVELKFRSEPKGSAKVLSIEAAISAVKARMQGVAATDETHS